MDIREINEKYAQIAQELIESEDVLAPIRDSDVRIIYLSSEHEKKKGKKLILGECEKVPDKWKWTVPCDFTITIFEPNIEQLSDEQLKILLLHELLHVGIEIDGNEEKYHIVPHDVEDFETILDRYGVHWSE